MSPSSSSRARRACGPGELCGHRVAVVPDHDAAGLAGARRRAQRLRGIAREVRRLEPLGGEPGSGYDLSDFVADARRQGRGDAAIRDELLVLADPPEAGGSEQVSG